MAKLKFFPLNKTSDNNLKRLARKPGFKNLYLNEDIMELRIKINYKRVLNFKFFYIFQIMLIFLNLLNIFII
jgi:hypothetical protein